MNSMVWLGLAALQLIAIAVSAEDFNHEKTDHHGMSYAEDSQPRHPSSDHSDWKYDMMSSSGVANSCTVLTAAILTVLIIAAARFGLH